MRAVGMNVLENQLSKYVRLAAAAEAVAAAPLVPAVR